MSQIVLTNQNYSNYKKMLIKLMNNKKKIKIKISIIWRYYLIKTFKILIKN